MMPRSPSLQPPHDLVRGVPDREMNEHRFRTGSNSEPTRTRTVAPRANAPPGPQRASSPRLRKPGRPSECTVSPQIPHPTYIAASPGPKTAACPPTTRSPYRQAAFRRTGAPNAPTTVQCSATRAPPQPRATVHRAPPASPSPPPHPTLRPWTPPPPSPTSPNSPSPTSQARSNAPSKAPLAASACAVRSPSSSVTPPATSTSPSRTRAPSSPASCGKTPSPASAWPPENGVEVIATGRITTYADRSSYQLIVERMEYAGAGALLARIEALRLRLAAEGLFDRGAQAPAARAAGGDRRRDQRARRGDPGHPHHHRPPLPAPDPALAGAGAGRGRGGAHRRRHRRLRRARPPAGRSRARTC